MERTAPTVPTPAFPPSEPLLDDVDVRTTAGSCSIVSVGGVVGNDESGDDDLHDSSEAMDASEPRRAMDARLGAFLVSRVSRPERCERACLRAVNASQ